MTSLAFDMFLQSLASLVESLLDSDLGRMDGA